MEAREWISMELEMVFDDNKMWKNYAPSPKIEACKKNAQRTKKNDIFRTFDLVMLPQGTPHVPHAHGSAGRYIVPFPNPPRCMVPWKFAFLLVLQARLV